MPPIAKENEVLTARLERSSANSDAAEPMYKPQPVALEVSVTVNGARTVDGSDKREPFSESTKTVLIFGNGAVIRLNSSVAPGQLLFLTNEKTKKEVVCQVVKSKNYRNVSGYVELEFTESVVGFWGMRFPGDRIAPVSSSPVQASQTFGSTAAGGAPPISRTVAPRIESPALATIPNTTAAKTQILTTAPKQAEELAAAKPVAPVAPITPAKSTSFDPEVALNSAVSEPARTESASFDEPRVSDAQASIFAPPPQSSVVPSLLEPLKFSSENDATPAAPAITPLPQAPVAANPETEALKQHTARLQEQLSALAFANSPADTSAKPPVAKSSEPAVVADVASKILDIAKTEPAAPPVKRSESPKRATVPAKSALEDEELQIPAWLEPLARNAAAPSSTQELIEREKAKRLGEQGKLEKTEEVFEEAISPGADEQASELPAPTFGNTLSFEEERTTGDASSKSSSGKGHMFAAIAAGVLLVAGGAWWYTRPQSNAVAASASGSAKSQSQNSASVIPSPTEPLQPQSSASLPANPSVAITTNTADHIGVSSQTKSAQNALPTANASGSATHSDKAAISSVNGGASPDAIAAAQPAAAEPKKPALGEVRLAAPTVKQRKGTQDNAEADAALALSSDQPSSDNEGIGAGLAVNTKGPAAPTAPIPVGGDVRTAKLLSSVAPVYPTLAKNQHVSGNVMVDALIDATGRVTTMKVVSGPTLLHQAAMDALKQWRYQPAMLDGKPVPMHLTVTIQFRLQ